MPLSTPMQTMTASDGLKLAYAIDDFSDPWAPQETLILIHAAMGSSRRLYKWIPALARHFRVVRPDMRGHGATAIPGPDQLSLTRLTQDVIELADHLGIKRFHLAGSSAGSIVAIPRATIPADIAIAMFLLIGDGLVSGSFDSPVRTSIVAAHHPSSLHGNRSSTPAT